MTRAMFFTLFAAAILMVAMGCSDNATQSNDSSGELNLEDEFGGYTAASETPAFGDNVLAETEDEEEEIKEKGERFEVCSQCAADRPRVRAFLAK